MTFVVDVNTVRGAGGELHLEEESQGKESLTCP